MAVGVGVGVDVGVGVGVELGLGVGDWTGGAVGSGVWLDPQAAMLNPRAKLRVTGMMRRIVSSIAGVC
jgi:hypothetical protein